MKKSIIGLCLASALSAAFSADAVPAKRTCFTDYIQPDGSGVKVAVVGDENCHYYLDENGRPMTADADGYLRHTTLQAIAERAAASPRTAERRAANDRRARAAAASAAASGGTYPQSGLGLFDNSFPSIGEIRGLVILVEYSDVKFSTTDPKEYFTSLLNEKGFSRNGGTGSARDYFVDQSGGRFLPTFDVYGPVTLPNRRRYYGGNDSYGNDKMPEDMVVDAAQALDPDVDFSQYDFNKDGNVDFVFIFYAGEGEADGGPAESVWPHQYELSSAGKSITVDGLRLDSYACTNEISGNTPAGIGTFVHEFSHVMGLPDLYHTSDSRATYTPGAWSVMDYGPYNNDGRTPPNYSMYERNALGWTTPVILGDPATVRLEEIGRSNRGCLAPTNRTNEFFLFENRQKTGWDRYIPGHGMLIWHIDFQQTVWNKAEVNNTRAHQYVDIVEANEYPNNMSNATMAGYAWPLTSADGKSDKTEYSATSSPAFKTWQGSTVMDITNISEKDGIITFDVNGGAIDIGTPAGFTATVNDDATATLTWTAVDIAESYRLDVYSVDADNSVSYLPGYQNLELAAGSTTVTVEGLMPETEYTATLRAICRNVSSDPAETAFSTGEIDFSHLRPVVLPPADIDKGSFTARWQELPGAVAYRLTVTAEMPGEYSQVYVPFGVTSSTKAVIPEGWTWTDSNLNDSYLESSRFYFGDDAPSLKFQKDGSTLTSPDFGKSISGLSFFMIGAGVNSPTYNALRVDGSNNGGEWFEIASCTPTAQKQTVVPDLTDKHFTALRFVYTKPMVGNVALDDIRFTLTESTAKVLEGYDGRNVSGTAESLSGLPENIRYFNYSVRGVDASGNISAASAGQRVDMNGHYSGIVPAGIDGTPALEVSIDGTTAVCTLAPGAAVTATDIAGRTVARAVADSSGCAILHLPVRGFYVIAGTGSAVKIFAGQP